MSYLQKIVTASKGRLSQLLPGVGNNQQVRASDLNTVIDYLNANRKGIVSGSGATVTLKAEQSGSTILFDRAAGIVFTLPAPVPGMYFDFLTTTAVTSNADTVQTNASTVFMGGTVSMGIEATTPGANPGPKLFSGNGTTHVKISSNGSTTGGLKGQEFRVTCVNSNLWMVSGIVLGSGTIATPFST